MDAKTRAPFACSFGTALGGVNRSLAAEPDQASGRPGTASTNQPRPASRTGRGRPLPLTDIDLHVTGERGSPADPLRSLAAILRRILASGGERPSPVEQDYVTGYLRQLLLVPSSPFFLDPLQLKAELNCAYLTTSRETPEHGPRSSDLPGFPASLPAGRTADAS
jgi:hypothetical protein